MNNLEAYKNDAGYIWLEAPNNIAYQGSTPINPVSSIYADPKKGPSGGRIPLTACKAKTWMAPGNSGNWVAFSIDRVCSDIADLSWVVAFMDSSIYAPSYFLDSKFFPSEPLFINTQSVPRPIKMKDQTVAFTGFIGTQNLDNPKVTSSVTSSLALPVQVGSLTPTICIPSLNGFTITTSLLKAGTCTLEAFALGNDLTNPSPRVTQSFTVNPKVMVRQNLKWPGTPEGVMVGDAPFDLGLSSDSGLPITVTSDSPNVCRFNDPNRPYFVTIVGSGTCYLTLRAPGSDKYYEISGSTDFWVEPKPVIVVKPTKSPTTPSPAPTRRQPTPTPKPTKKIVIVLAPEIKDEDFNPSDKKGGLNTKPVKKVTIVCLNGKTTKKVTDIKPVCPKGWVKK